jgi:hypothetical protein
VRGAARRLFHRSLATAVVAPVEVGADQAACYLRVLEEALPEAWHRIDRYANKAPRLQHATSRCLAEFPPPLGSIALSRPPPTLIILGSSSGREVSQFGQE